MDVKLAARYGIFGFLMKYLENIIIKGGSLKMR